MKNNIHPNWNHNCVVTCGCGNVFTTGSGSETLKVDICSKCHPFFTGEMRFVDRQGRVDNFIRKQRLAEERKKLEATKKVVKKAQGEAKSYQDILRDQQVRLRKQKDSLATPVAATASAASVPASK